MECAILTALGFLLGVQTFKNNFISPSAVPGLCMPVVDGPLHVMHPEEAHLLGQLPENWRSGQGAHDSRTTKGDPQNRGKECQGQGE